MAELDKTKGLMVWLSLDGNLNNKGLDGYKPSGSPSWSTEGKLASKSLYCDGHYINCTSSKMTASKASIVGEAEQSGEIRQFTIAFWHKALNTNTYSSNESSLRVGLKTVSNSDNGLLTKNTNFWFLRGTNDTVNASMNLYWSYSFGNNSTSYRKGTSSNDDKWHHYAIVCDGEYFRYYKDGVVSTAYKLSDYLYSYLLTGSYNFGKNALCYLQDFRLYSYAFSLLEIKELSRGKVGHWLGDGNGTFLKNLCTNTNDLTNWYCYGWIYKDRVSVSASNTFLVQNSVGWCNLLYDCNSLKDKTFTISATVKLDPNHDVSDDKGLRVSFDRRTNNTNTGNRYTVASYILKSSQGWKRFSATFNSLSTDTPWCGFYLRGVTSDASTNNCWVYIKDIKIEEGTAASTFCTSTSPTFLSDISGFGRHGQVVGNVILDSSTPRYDKSIKFSTNTCERYIAAPAMNFLTNTLTFSCWVSQFSRTGVNDGKDNTLLFIMSQGRDNTAGFSLICNNGVPGVAFGNGTTFKWIYNTTSMPLNTWHHIAATYDGTNVKFYYDGNYVVLSAISDIGYLLRRNPTTDILEYPNPALVLGKMSFGYTNANVYFPFAGNISDARVYATALSADDVKELYSLGH